MRHAHRGVSIRLVQRFALEQRLGEVVELLAVLSGGDRLQIGGILDRHGARVHLEDLQPALLVGRTDRDAAVEPPSALGGGNDPAA